MPMSRDQQAPHRAVQSQGWNMDHHLTNHLRPCLESHSFLIVGSGVQSHELPQAAMQFLPWMDLETIKELGGNINKKEEC